MARHAGRGARVGDKSIGAEETFDVDHHDGKLLKRELLRLSERTAADAALRGVRGRTVSIKVGSPISPQSPSRTLAVATDVTQSLPTACRLWTSCSAGAVRLIGPDGTTRGTTGSGEQLALTRPNTLAGCRSPADQAPFPFGSSAIRPASLLNVKRTKE